METGELRDRRKQQQQQPKHYSEQLLIFIVSPLSPQRNSITGSNEAETWRSAATAHHHKDQHELLIFSKSSHTLMRRHFNSHSRTRTEGAGRKVVRKTEPLGQHLQPNQPITPILSRLKHPCCVKLGPV